MTKHWLAADWPAPENIKAGTTLRSGGISSGKYCSLNLAMHVGDNPRNVIDNRKRIKSLLELPAEPMWLQQTHGSRVVRAECADNLEADASFSNKKNIICAIMTADCLPLLLCSQDGGYVAAVHGGWRGLLAGVIENTVNAMQQRDLLAWMGPAIGPKCFEVGAEVCDTFIHKRAEYSSAFSKLENSKWFADIYRIARITLMANGITRIYGGEYCTVTDQSRFYSYRREGETGRMTTLIWRIK
ncbi:MAG: peptidoglycan editing factor PgeF [Methylococcales bacterium]|nr:peptidoglycan editing factor PgeF [Methylococcales bacterium]